MRELTLWPSITTARITEDMQVAFTRKIAFCIVAAALPATRWIVVEQLRRKFDSSSARTESRSRILRRAAADQNPADVRYQIAAAISDEKGNPEVVGENLHALRALTHRFPHEPILRAAILRYDLVVGILDVDNGLLPAVEAPNHERLARIEDEARAGEAVEPDNAFFTAVRAAAELASHHDATAFALLQRASEKPVWETYVNSTGDALFEMDQKVHGRQSFLARYTRRIKQSPMFWTALRGIATLAVKRAQESERHGEFRSGVAIRHALIGLGYHIAEAEPESLGQVCGTWIATRATAVRSTAGVGQAAGTVKATLYGAALRQKHAAEYRAFLLAHGARGESAWTDVRLAECERVADSAVTGITANDFRMRRFELSWLWLATEEFLILLLGDTLRAFLAPRIKRRPTKRLATENLAANRRKAITNTVVLIGLQVTLMVGTAAVYWVLNPVSTRVAAVPVIYFPSLFLLLRIYLEWQLIMLPVTLALVIGSSLFGGWSTQADLGRRFLKWHASMVVAVAVLWLLVTFAIASEETWLGAQLDATVKSASIHAPRV